MSFFLSAIVMWTTDGILCASFLPVCVLVLVHSNVNAILDVGHDKSFKALHEYRGEGYWPIVIQACHCGRFGDQNDQSSGRYGPPPVEGRC